MDYEASVARVFEMLSSGKIVAEIGHRYPLKDAVQAHSDLENGLTAGSSVLLP